MLTQSLSLSESYQEDIGQELPLSHLHKEDPGSFQEVLKDLFQMPGEKRRQLSRAQLCPCHAQMATLAKAPGVVCSLPNSCWNLIVIVTVLRSGGAFERSD
jgi:hypothetical protein